MIAERAAGWIEQTLYALCLRRWAGQPPEPVMALSFSPSLAVFPFGIGFLLWPVTWESKWRKSKEEVLDHV